ESAGHIRFTRTADELAVTPAAVGQQIRALEDMLGVVMFRRTPKGLELTDEAAAGLDALRSGSLEVEDAVRAMQAGQSSHKLTIAAPRAFTAKSLDATLAKFCNENKDVSLALVASEDGGESTEGNLDVAIGLSDGPGNNEGVLLGDTMFVQVAAPGSKAGQKIDWPGCPISEDEETLMRVADGGLAIEAAANGFGHAWVPK